MKEIMTNLSSGALDRTVVDTIDDVMGIHAVHRAAHGLCGAEDFLHAAGELLRHGPGPHDAGGLDDVVHGDVAAVLDVLHLLPVPGGLLESFDDEGGGGRHHRHLGLSVLDTELDGNL